MKNIVLIVAYLLYSAVSALSDGLILPTYACPKYKIEDTGSKWIAYVGEVYVLEGYDPNSFVFKNDAQDQYLRKNDPNYKGSPTRYIISLAGVNVSVPIEAISLIPSNHSDYERAAKINIECAKRLQAAVAEYVKQNQQPKADPYANPDAAQNQASPYTDDLQQAQRAAAQQQSGQNIWKKGSSLNPISQDDQTQQQQIEQNRRMILLQHQQYQMDQQTKFMNGQ